MKYIEGKGYFVGRFNENDLKNGIDKIEVEKAKNKTGLKYTNQKIIYKNKKPIAIDLYVCSVDDLNL